MATVTFDTLKFVNRLKNAGIPSVHAEAEADALSEVFETNLSELATKEDLRHEIKELETGLRHEIDNVRHEISDLRKDIDAKLEKLELRMTIKLGSIVVVALGAFTVIFKFL